MAEATVELGGGRESQCQHVGEASIGRLHGAHRPYAAGKAFPRVGVRDRCLGGGHVSPHLRFEGGGDWL